MIKGFKPNLIPNNPKDGSFDIEARNAVINKNGGPSEYYGILKKDGCRMQFGLSEKIFTRSLKGPKSKLVRERFDAFNKLCLELKIAVDAEFYMHGLKFNAINRFFAKEDVTCPKYKEKLEKEFKKNPDKFVKDYDALTIPFLTTFHRKLEAWVFDAVIIDRPDLKGFDERLQEMYTRISNAVEDDEKLKSLDFIVFPDLEKFETCEDIDRVYEDSLELNYEGVVLVHKKHEYKFGRNSLKQGTILKLKDDVCEYDGIVVDVLEGTKIKEGVERTTNELGHSETSKKKDDREPSGKAKGFVVEFEDKGQFIVGLNGFDDEDKIKLLENKEKYIGRHFKYVAMPPVKDFPRSAYFNCWRDEK